MSESSAAIIIALVWPITVLIVVFMFKKNITDLFTRISKIKSPPLGIELMLDELETRRILPFGARRELSGLTSHDIWALDEFGRGAINVLLTKMNVPQRVAARTLIDAKLLTIDGAGENRKVILTELGKKIIEIAGQLLN